MRPASSRVRHQHAAVGPIRVAENGHRGALGYLESQRANLDKHQAAIETDMGAFTAIGCGAAPHPTAVARCARGPYDTPMVHAKGSA